MAWNILERKNLHRLEWIFDGTSPGFTTTKNYKKLSYHKKSTLTSQFRVINKNT